MAHHRIKAFETFGKSRNTRKTYLGVKAESFIKKHCENEGIAKEGSLLRVTIEGGEYSLSGVALRGFLAETAEKGIQWAIWSTASAIRYCKENKVNTLVIGIKSF